MEQITKTESDVIMRRALASLKGKWGLAIGTFLIYMVISAASGSIKNIGPIIASLIAGPFALGAAFFSLSVSRGEAPRVEQLFLGFKHLSKTIATYILMVLFIVLWMLLLIIPGIVAALSYSLTFFILADDISLKPMAALEKSKQMMSGYKWKLCGLLLKFFLLALLCILTLGIGYFWLIPYIYITMAEFYDDIKWHRKVALSA